MGLLSSTASYILSPSLPFFSLPIFCHLSTSLVLFYHPNQSPGAFAVVEIEMIPLQWCSLSRSLINGDCVGSSLVSLHSVLSVSCDVRAPSVCVFKFFSLVPSSAMLPQKMALTTLQRPEACGPYSKQP